MLDNKLGKNETSFPFKHSSVCLHHQALGTITRGRQTSALNQRSKQKITRQNVYCKTVLAITTKMIKLQIKVK